MARSTDRLHFPLTQSHRESTSTVPRCHAASAACWLAKVTGLRSKGWRRLAVPGCALVKFENSSSSSGPCQPSGRHAGWDGSWESRAGMCVPGLRFENPWIFAKGPPMLANQTRLRCGLVFFFFFSWGPRRTDYVLFLTCFFFVGDGSLSRFLFETKIVVLQHVFNCPCVSSRILGTKCRTTCRFRFRFTARTVNNSLSTTGPCHHAANFVVSMFHGRGPPRAPQPVPNDWDPRT